uniref:Uncharacterized protein n=1 Tax=Arundo donax TaxID=35708 RepID=A0A0A9H8R6_ARUDO
MNQFEFEVLELGVLQIATDIHVLVVLLCCKVLGPSSNLPSPSTPPATPTSSSLPSPSTPPANPTSSSLALPSTPPATLTPSSLPSPSTPPASPTSCVSASASMPTGEATRPCVSMSASTATS